MEEHNYIPTYFDRLVHKLSKNGWGNKKDVISFIFESKETRFSRFEDRVEKLKMLHLDEVDPAYGLTFSQGTHTTLKWKSLPILKSIHDLAIYSMLIDEVKPEVIIEYGSGHGSSAIWLSDMCMIHGLNTKIITYDYNKVDLNYPNVVYKNLDLVNLDLNEDEVSGRKIVIEDAHSHVYDVLLKTDVILKSGDYLIIEDSYSKQNIIFNFLKTVKNKYVVDNYYVDFFGINSSSAWNSILKMV